MAANVKVKDINANDPALSGGRGDVECYTSSADSVAVLKATYRDAYKELLTYARGRVNSKEVAQDIVHQAFTNTLSSIERGAQIQNMAGFLQRCICNLCVSHLRRERPESMDNELYRPTMTERSAESVATDKAQWQQVSSVVDGLAPHQRYAFLASELHGIEHEEIGRRIGRSTKSVTQLVYRARRRIRERVAPGRVAGWWPLGGLRRKNRREKQRGHSSSFVGVQLATANAWLARVFSAGANSILQPQTPMAVATVVFALATVSVPQAIEDRNETGGEVVAAQISSASAHQRSKSREYSAQPKSPATFSIAKAHRGNYVGVTYRARKAPSGKRSDNSGKRSDSGGTGTGGKGGRNKPRTEVDTGPPAVGSSPGPSQPEPPVVSENPEPPNVPTVVDNRPTGTPTPTPTPIPCSDCTSGGGGPDSQ